MFIWCYLLYHGIVTFSTLFVAIEKVVSNKTDTTLNFLFFLRSCQLIYLAYLGGAFATDQRQLVPINCIGVLAIGIICGADW